MKNEAAEHNKERDDKVAQHRKEVAEHSEKMSEKEKEEGRASRRERGGGGQARVELPKKEQEMQARIEKEIAKVTKLRVEIKKTELRQTIFCRIAFWFISAI